MHGMNNELFMTEISRVLHHLFLGSSTSHWWGLIVSALSSGG